jgi:DNA-binding NarL/FixJ family response regulator
MEELKCQLSAISGAVASIRKLLAEIIEPSQQQEPAADPPELADLAYREEWTPREKDVAALVIRGYRNKEIATELGVTEQTVKNHLRNMCEKIGASDRIQVAMYALRLGIR